MIELSRDSLVFTFPEVHPEARLTVVFQRTLRIPDNDQTYPLPPGLGAFPLRHVDDHAQRVPPAWIEHGGVMLPMYQAEALWLYFQTNYLSKHGTSYPFAVKIATGKINAVSGQTWSGGLHRNPQDYLVAPTQPWLDGYCVSKGTIRQFVAMPLGQGYTAEEQITGAAEHGGLQIIAYPMKRAAFEKRFPERDFAVVESAMRCFAVGGMGLAPGGKMRQEIYADPYDVDDWELNHRSRCFVHILNSIDWQAVTGKRPPHQPPTAKAYTQAGLPWFDYYHDNATAVAGAAPLAGLKSVAEKSRERDEALHEPVHISAEQVVRLRAALKPGQVREGAF